MCEAKMSGSPTSLMARPPIFPPKWSKAATATSGPMPEGSPMVIRIGDGAPLPDEGIRLAVVAYLDIGLALQVAQIATGQSGDLILEQLVFHLLAGRHDK